MAGARKGPRRQMSIGRIQVALADSEKAAALLTLLERNTETPVERVRVPVAEDASVVVVDPASFAQMPGPLASPDRVVLVSKGEPDCLRDAWDAGVSSVVSDRDPLDTLVLAVLSACLRAEARCTSNLSACPSAHPKLDCAGDAEASILLREESEND